MRANDASSSEKELIQLMTLLVSSRQPYDGDKPVEVAWQHADRLAMLARLRAAVEEQFQAAIIEAAREAVKPGSHLSYTAIGRAIGYSREHVSRIATKAGIKRRKHV